MSSIGGGDSDAVSTASLPTAASSALTSGAHDAVAGYAAPEAAAAPRPDDPAASTTTTTTTTTSSSTTTTTEPAFPPLEPASHGCIRVPQAVSDVFHQYVSQGDAVYVFDGVMSPEAYGAQLPVFNRIDPNWTAPNAPTITAPPS